MRISDWSSYVCSSDLFALELGANFFRWTGRRHNGSPDHTIRRKLFQRRVDLGSQGKVWKLGQTLFTRHRQQLQFVGFEQGQGERRCKRTQVQALCKEVGDRIGITFVAHGQHVDRSEEHTSELQSLMRISYAVFCLK